MPVLIGTSGWQYAHWKRVFYPAGVPQRLWLEHHAALFQTVEVNNAFYRLPERRTFQQWALRTPADYVITVKASRFLTHMKRLIDPQEPVQRLMDRVAGLGAKLGAVLVQLPPTMQAEPGRLDETLEWFPKSTRVAVEPRHESWWNADVEAVLRDRGAALVWADRNSTPIAPLWRTTNWGYLRLHMGGISSGSRSIWPYDEAVLAQWADRICEKFDDAEDVYVYTNNDPEAAALRDAVTLGRLLRARGRTVTRLPTVEQVVLEPYEPWGG